MTTTTGYGPKTLVTGWNFDESYPKDFDAFNPPGGDQHKSTHKRLGTWTENVMMPESLLTQKAVLAEPRGGSSGKRSLVNLLTFSQTLGEHRKKYWKQCGIFLPPETSYCTNYTSTYKVDYTNFSSERPKIVSREQQMKPETKFRRLLVDGADPRRPGFNRFYDDNMEYLRVRIKERAVPPFALDYTPRVV